MLFYFRKGKNATQTRKKSAIYEEDDVSERVCQNWFVKFRAIYLDLCKILILEKISLFWKIAKGTLKSFSPIKLESSGRMEFLNCLKGSAKLLKKTMNTLLNKITF